MNPEYPEKLYCYLGENGRLALSTTEPAGQWVRYAHCESTIKTSERYDLYSISSEKDQTYWFAPVSIQVIESLGDYFIL
jgi:hypothetical protein